MSNNLLSKDEINYRAIYGKLFSGLLNQFGANYVSEIEDAIQNSFLKSLKIWKQNNVPNNKENWLFIVARNDVLNQIKKQKENNNFSVEQFEDTSLIGNKTDLRLQTITFISGLDNISNQAKILFVLKNIFGLSISEISESTLINKEAVYKSINRTKKNIQLEYSGNEIDFNSITANSKAISIVEEILYAVFNIGFDSFSEKTENIVNEDLCLEAFALTKLLYNQYQSDSTSNLLTLFCFHIARIPAKINSGKLISFFKQDRTKWNKEFFNLGFHYLKKQKEISKFYIEAIIISKYMSKSQFTQNDWIDIVKLYELMQKVSRSPIIKLNYCFCLSKIGKAENALAILSEIEKELPNEHIYFSLVKAKILKEANPKEADDLFISVMNKMNQRIRKEYLLENELIRL
ncbi:RNA polymerase [Riemerella anatipestifer]|nr:RNA polymerase [Riemerella anatipestifer]